jgi:hypothetical protein
LLMIGYHVGSQTNTVQIIWSLVIAGWVFFGVGLIGYFTMFTIVLIRRYLKKKQPTNGVVKPNASLESHAIRK